jgi:hypothetical protein
MIHHISIDAQNPLRVASVLAELWHGKTYQFLVPGSYAVLPFDNYGTHIVVFQTGDAWHPGTDHESAKVMQSTPTHFMPLHAAISIPATHEEIEHIGKREGWRTLIRRQGKGVPFSVVEFWVENRILFEFFPSEFLPEYLQTMQPNMIQKILGEAIEPALV